MTLTNARATLGLNATATLGAAGTSGSITLGNPNETIRLTSTTNGYHLQAVFANSGDTVTLALASNTTSSATAWVAGAAQVETATAAGTITTSGNATAIVTSAGMSGSPLTVTFAVTSGDTAAEWATKCRTALAANATIAARFDVSGSTTAVVLTRKPSHTFTVPGGTLPIYLATDSTLNIALADDTSAGITEATTSTGTVAGTASDGVKLYDNSVDIEGESISLGTALYGIQYKLTAAEAVEVVIDGSTSDYIRVAGGETLCKASQTAIATDASYVLTAGGAGSLEITVLGA